MAAAVSVMPNESASSQLSDEQLLKRWRDGNRRAGDILLSRHRASLRAYFVHRVAAPDGEDLVQETMSRVTRAIRKFECRSSFHTYLMSIARNTFHDHLRRGYRRISVESLDDASVGEPAFAEHCLLELERHHLAYACLRGLPPETRELVERFYWHGISARQIGCEQGIPPGTVRRRLFEARAALHELYLRGTDPQRGEELELEQLRSFVSSGATRAP
jgi:RNA polymerase sigma-70 factor (ECF subfamily)